MKVKDGEMETEVKTNRYCLYSPFPVLLHTPFFSLLVNFATSFFLTSILHSNSPQGARVSGLQISLQAIRRDQNHISHTMGLTQYDLQEIFFCKWNDFR